MASGQGGSEDTVNESTQPTAQPSPRGQPPGGLGRSGWWPPGTGPRRTASHGRGWGPPEHAPAYGHHKPRPGRGGGPGGEILFWAFAVGGTEPTSQEDIFGIDSATGAVRRLTDNSSGVPFVSDRDPDWSPGRDRIVFMSAEAGEATHMPVVSATGAPVADLLVEGGTPGWLDAGTVVCMVWRDGPTGS